MNTNHDSKHSVTISNTMFNDLVSHREELTRLREKLQETEDDLDWVLTQFNWGTFLWGVFVGLAIGAVPFFLTLRHFNLLG